MCSRAVEGGASEAPRIVTLHGSPEFIVESPVLAISHARIGRRSTVSYGNGHNAVSSEGHVGDTNMQAERAVAEEEFDDALFLLEPVDPEKIPPRHPVGVFATRYREMTEGHFIPDERKLLEDPVIRELSSWLDHVEPVEMGGHVDFYILDPGEAFSGATVEYEDGKWMGDTMDDGFAAARYHECVSASILRKPRFSRGAVPSAGRSFMKQYRGVFPVFAENHARLRLAIMAAETFIELKE